MGDKKNIQRRDFLKTLGLGAAAATLPIHLIPGKAQAETVGIIRLNNYGVLVDTRKCVNCKSCQITCKVWNDNQPDPSSFKTDFTAQTWTFIQEKEVGSYDQESPTVKFAPAKRQCMHCADPVCVSNCPKGGLAIHKEPDGPVLVNHENCIRCQACVNSCPYGVPKLDTEADQIVKCIFCFGRLREGIMPACVNTCPPGALQFSSLDEIRGLAFQAAFAGYPVYGLPPGEETSWIYIFPQGFEPDQIIQKV